MKRSAEVLIRAPTRRVFAVLCDFAQTPTWLDQCMHLELVDGGPPRTGARVLYRHDVGQGGFEEMDGVIEQLTAPSALTLRYEDPTRVIIARWQLWETPAGCRVRHTLEILPRKLMARLMAPLRAGPLRAQLSNDVAGLKSYVENAAALF